jgi:phosphopantetheine--protein transferase-like protein
VKDLKSIFKTAETAFTDLELRLPLSVGIDLVDVESFRLDVDSEEVLQAMFTKEELDECNGDMERLAGKFAVKEALVKALGTGFRGISELDITVRSFPRGRPAVVLTPTAEALVTARGFAQITCSLAHEEGLAIAIVAGVRTQEGISDGR